MGIKQEAVKCAGRELGKRHILRKTIDEICDRLDTSPRKTLVQISQRMACLHDLLALQHNCCIDILIRQLCFTRSATQFMKQA
jgi:hypothetical protein